ncbi:MAG: hypothetical protein H0T68_06510 [Gemmatimonadales bacterium]|nr:hypothetical protein [Gemmatimonadales bacterium]
MSYAPQSSPGRFRLPACALALVLLAGPVAAQDERSLSTPADLHREPQGAPLVTLPAGAPVETGAARGDWREATVEGWIYTQSTAPTRRDGFDLVVTEDEGENLRRSPNGPVVGRARAGTLLERVGRQGRWTQVRREGWLPRQAVQTPAPAPRRAQRGQGTAAPATPTPKPAAPAPPVESGPDEFQVARQTGLNVTPGGPAVGTLQTGITARVLGRTGEWARVRVEGWVREADLQPNDGGALAGVTAAEVRSAPERYVGQQLDWRLQIISVQVADELRAEMAPGQPYLLTRGPLPEPGFVYVAIPHGQVDRFRALPPLHEAVLRVTIRAPRTRYLTTPVAELASVVSGLEGK